MTEADNPYLQVRHSLETGQVDQRLLPKLEHPIFRLEKLSNDTGVWERIMLAARFYFAYSPTKSQLLYPDPGSSMDPERFVTAVRMASGCLDSEVAAHFGVIKATISNARDSMDTILQIALREEELAAIGCRKALLCGRHHGIRQKFQRYPLLPGLLKEDDDIDYLARTNGHFKSVIKHLAGGFYVDEIAALYGASGRDIGQAFRGIAYHYNQAFVTGLSPDCSIKDYQNFKTNYEYLRNLILARYVYHGYDADLSTNRNPDSRFIQALQRLVEIPDPSLTLSATFIRHLPLYEHAISRPQASAFVSQPTTENARTFLALRLQSGRRLEIMPWLGKRILQGKGYKEIAPELRDRGVDLTVDMIESHIGVALGLCETMLLDPQIAYYEGCEFRRQISRSHYREVAMLMRYLAGRADGLNRHNGRWEVRQDE